MKAIETFYRGNLFRSRIEARWAVFFSTLGIPYEYEKEGFELERINYLPDFWLPIQKCWIEIKGEKPTQNEIDKGLLLHDATGNNVFIFYGQIPYPDPEQSHSVSSSFAFLGNSIDLDYWWCECPHCSALDIQYYGRSGRIVCCATNEENNKEDRKNYSFDSPRLLEAYYEARIARFEYGC